MLLDWLTLRVPSDVVGDQQALKDYRENRPHLARFIPATGEVEWVVTTRESSRSDSHGIVVHVGGWIEITGSPSRSLGMASNVFGTLDIQEAALAHIEAAEQVLGFRLPRDFAAYRCTRVDVTTNHYLGQLPEVRQALAYLRQSDGGRYKVRATAETVYWSPGSRNRSGKAYAKGPHLEKQVREGKAWATDDEIRAAQGLLRLELKLAGDWWRVQREQGRRWWTFGVQDFLKEHQVYFADLIGTVEVSEMTDVRAALEAVAPTLGQAAAAHRTWCVIQSVGHQQAKASMPSRSWYRHLQLLKAAGLGWGDLAAGKVVPIRKTPLVLSQPVAGWDEILRAA